MRIALVTPAGKNALTGNRTTAVRWAAILRDLGHRVHVTTGGDGAAAELMVAIHAWRSARSIDAFRERHPRRPLIVLLAGTDIYRYQRSHPSVVHRSMEQASALVGLNERVARAIPARFAPKLTVIHQSALPLAGPRKPSTRYFDALVVANARREKDPLRAALAARLAAPDSRQRVVHAGAASGAVRRAIEAEVRRNRRYRWRGPVPRWQVRRLYARARLLVLSSRSEGGANVISEALAAGLPVLATRIDGNVGLLGSDYAGYFPVGDTAALAALLRRAEFEPGFLARLERQCRALAPRFRPQRERRAWRVLIRRLTAGKESVE